MVHHFTTALIRDADKAVAKWQGANDSTICRVPTGPPVLQRVPRWKKGHLGLQDTQWEWFFSIKVRVLAIKLAQHRTEQTTRLVPSY
jgi:hypothetical protein